MKVFTLVPCETYDADKDKCVWSSFGSWLNFIKQLTCKSMFKFFGFFGGVILYLEVGAVIEKEKELY